MLFFDKYLALSALNFFPLNLHTQLSLENNAFFSHEDFFYVDLKRSLRK